MKFRELLNLYREGQLDEDARREVEEAIDREDAILEYLSERDEIAIPDEEEAAADAPDDRDAQMEERFRTELTRRIRRAFIRLGVCVGAVLLAVLLLVEFVLPKVVDRFYYDPGEIAATYQTEFYEYKTNRMSLDMAVYSELFLPGIVRDNVSCIDHGYGEYDIVIEQNISFTGSFTDVGGRISKGQLTLYDSNTLKRPVGNTFEWGMNMPDPAIRLSEQEDPPEVQPDGSVFYNVAGIAGYPDEARERLESLEDDTVYQGFVSLDAVMDFDSFQTFLYKNDIAGNTLWCAVQLAERPSFAANIGYDTYQTSSAVCFDSEKYPFLKSCGYDENATFQFTTEAVATEHLRSMLRYMADHQDFWNMMGLDKSYGSVQDMINYLDANGIHIYGFSLTADKATLLALQESPDVYSVAAEPIR